MSKIPAKLEIIAVRADARKTGIGAIFETDEQALAAFQHAKRLEVPDEKAEFLVDYYNPAGDLENTILIDAAGFRQITGEDPKDPAYYETYDLAYWACGHVSHARSHEHAKAKADATLATPARV